MIANKTNAESDLKTALTSLETSLATPIISGELADWVEDLQKAWDEASAQIHYAIHHLHPRTYEEMGKQDAELLPRMELLRGEDQAIKDDRERIGGLIARDVKLVPTLEPDEGRAYSYLKPLIDEGLAFVLRVRKQEVALETWLAEAFNRDRGSVD
jgi:hypothetical protein